MRRLSLIVAGAVAGLAAVVGLHPASSTTTALRAGGPAAGGPATGGPATTTPPTTAPAAPPTTAPGAPTTTAPGASAPTTPPTTAPVATTRSSTGPAEQYGYGTLSVKVTVTGNKITKITTPTLQTAEQYSQQLAAQVIPMLNSEVLKAQSLNINGISGASYTASAYATSLQAALKNLHFP